MRASPRMKAIIVALYRFDGIGMSQEGTKERNFQLGNSVAKLSSIKERQTGSEQSPFISCNPIRCFWDGLARKSYSVLDHRSSKVRPTHFIASAKHVTHPDAVAIIHESPFPAA